MRGRLNLGHVTGVIENNSLDNSIKLHYQYLRNKNVLRVGEL